MTLLAETNMTNHQRHSSWREKRRARDREYDAKKKAKADRERYRRGRFAVFKKANSLFQDGREIGHDRRVYVCVFEKGKGRNAQGKYFTYNSHPDECWPPAKEEVVNDKPPT